MRQTHTHREREGERERESDEHYVLTPSIVTSNYVMMRGAVSMYVSMCVICAGVSRTLPRWTDARLDRRSQGARSRVRIRAT